MILRKKITKLFKQFLGQDLNPEPWKHKVRAVTTAAWYLIMVSVVQVILTASGLEKHIKL
jgi:hypothetical protein